MNYTGEELTLMRRAFAHCLGRLAGKAPRPILEGLRKADDMVAELLVEEENLFMTTFQEDFEE